VIAGGEPSGYGYVGNLFGLQLFVDANLPTNLGANTNSDPIIALASRCIPLLERPSDPVTLSFEAQAASSLQIQLACYGYLALVGGRYPGAIGIVSGSTPPAF
jgi:hypothetical protein